MVLPDLKRSPHHLPSKLSSSPTTLLLPTETIWVPATYAQAEALKSPAEILLFGGAAGGTKTQTLIVDAVREAYNPNLSAILFRESYPQLADIIHKTRKFYEGPPYWGSYIASDHRWIFPENLADMWRAHRQGKQLGPVYGRGASIKLGYLRNDDDCHDHDARSTPSSGGTRAPTTASTSFAIC